MLWTSHAAAAVWAFAAELCLVAGTTQQSFFLKCPHHLEDPRDRLVLAPTPDEALAPIQAWVRNETGLHPSKDLYVACSGTSMNYDHKALEGARVCLYDGSL